MPRKIVQIAVIPQNDDYYPRIIVLTNDNKIFVADLMSNNEVRSWGELKAIPQDDYNA